MYVLLVDITLGTKPQAVLEEVYRDTFRPAIARQPRFAQVELLTGDEDRAVLFIGFDDRAAQQAWVATELHGDVWAAMQAAFNSYSVRDFNSVD